jgi:hypothetical protein
MNALKKKNEIILFFLTRLATLIGFGVAFKHAAQVVVFCEYWDLGWVQNSEGYDILD